MESEVGENLVKINQQSLSKKKRKLRREREIEGVKV